MMSYFNGSLEVAWPAFLFGLYSLLVGLGIKAAFAAHVHFPRSVGITAGMGLSLTALLMVYSHLLLDRASLPIVPIAAVAVLCILARFKIEISNGEIVTTALQASLSNAKQIYKELYPILITIIVMIPVLKYGLTAWTSGTNDFPSYAASADIWMNSQSVFSERHQDAFGALQINRASFEKPIVTGMLVLASKLSGLPPYQLLSPLVAVLLFIGLSSLMALIRALFKFDYLTATLTISLPTFSVVPISRLYDAQFGQVAALALLVCMLAVLALPAPRRGLGASVILGFVAAVVGTAALGTNFTLIAGSSIMLGAAFLWVLSKRPLPFRSRLQLAVLSLILTVILSMPMIRLYIYSASIQTTGEPGHNIPLASPLSVIGQQRSLTDVVSVNQTLALWCLVIAITLVALWARRPARSQLPVNLIFVIATTTNAALIGLLLGWNNYATHKWFGVFIAFSAPLLIAYGVSLIRGRIRSVLVVTLMAPLAASSAFFGLQKGFGISHVIHTDLLSLRENAYLATQDLVNIRLGNLRDNSIAALVVPSQRVVVVERTYAPASFPGAGLSLVRRENIDLNPTTSSKFVILNETYALISTFLEVTETPVHFTNSNPHSRNHLFGNWHASEEWGTWSGPEENYILFKLAEEFLTGDVLMALMGKAYTPEGTSQTVAIYVNDTFLTERTYPASDEHAIEIILPERVVNADGGRIKVSLRVTQPHSPAQFGSADKRKLGFGLTALAITPAR